MRTWTFDLLTDEDMTAPERADVLFEAFEGDVTPAVVAGAPRLMCSVDGDDLLGTIRDTVARVEALGVEVRQVQMEREAVAA